MKAKTWLAVAFVVGIAGVAGTAWAQADDPKQLLEQASTLARDERFDEAIAIWLGVLDRLDASDLATTNKKLGVAFQQTGRLAEAWHYLSLYLASPTGKGDETMADSLKEVEAGLEQTHVKVTFSCHPADATILLPSSRPPGLQASTPCSTTAWLTPGEHELQAEAPGYQPQTVVINVDRTGDFALPEIRLAEVGTDTGLITDSTLVEIAESDEPSRILEWTLIGSGAAMGVAGAIFHGLAYSRNQELDTEYADPLKHPYGPGAKDAYDADFNDEVRPKQIAAYVLYGVGGAALVGGIVTWFLRGPEEKSSDSGPLTIAPLTLPGGTGALVTFEF